MGGFAALGNEKLEEMKVSTLVSPVAEKSAGVIYAGDEKYWHRKVLAPKSPGA